MELKENIAIKNGCVELPNSYLFRGKTISGAWAEGLLAHKDGKYYISNSAGAPFAFEIQPESICRCTGLESKNGELIFENDIADFLGHRGIVKFECGSFGIAYENYIDWDEIQTNIMPITGCENALYACENDNYISLWEIYWNFNDEDNSLSTVEVIGNSFDNPELLMEEEKKI